MRFFRHRQPKLLILAPHYQFNCRAFATIPLTPSPNGVTTKTLSETVDCCVFVPLSSWHRPNWKSHIPCLFASPSHINSPPFSRHPSMMARICCLRPREEAELWGDCMRGQFGWGEKDGKIGVGGDGSNRWLIMVSILQHSTINRGLTTVETE
jgi:hypothetical protein